MNLLPLGLLIVAILLVCGNPILTGILKAVERIKPSTASNPTVVGLTNIMGTAQKYAQYATAHGAIYTLRLVDFENPNLDISPELTAIDSKLAAAVKGGNPK